MRKNASRGSKRSDKQINEEKSHKNEQLKKAKVIKISEGKATNISCGCVSDLCVCTPDCVIKSRVTFLHILPNTRATSIP